MEDTANQQPIQVEQNSRLQMLLKQKSVLIGAGVIGLFIVLLLLFFALRPQPNPTTDTATNTPIEFTEKSVLDEPVGLSFSPPALLVQNESITPLSVNFVFSTSVKNRISEVVIVATYDPTMLTNVSLQKEGTSSFSNWTETSKKIANGRIDYSLKAPTNAALLAQGGLAKLTFSPNGRFTNLKSTILITDDSYVVLEDGTRQQLKENELLVIFPE